MLTDPAVSGPVKQKLTLVQDLRSYAAQALHLPAEAQYDRYTDLGRKYVVWVVYAAPEFSVKAKTWWYPLLGSLKYRGYFNEQDAEHEADHLRREGYDVYVGGVAAYSTLGWFRDPILNTFLRQDDAELAEMLFHELSHQRLYFSGDTDFNEAFATAVGTEGARRWLAARGRAADLKQFNADVVLEREFIDLVLQTRRRLDALYQRTDIDDGRKRALKTAEFTRMRSEADKLKRQNGASVPVDRWFSKPVNNARLNTLATYFDLVPSFEHRLADEGGDLEAFFRKAEGMKGMSPSERKKRLKIGELKAGGGR